MGSHGRHMGMKVSLREVPWDPMCIEAYGRSHDIPWDDMGGSMGQGPFLECS